MRGDGFLCFHVKILTRCLLFWMSEMTERQVKSSDISLHRQSIVEAVGKVRRMDALKICPVHSQGVCSSQCLGINDYAKESEVWYSILQPVFAAASC